MKMVNDILLTRVFLCKKNQSLNTTMSSVSRLFLLRRFLKSNRAAVCGLKGNTDSFVVPVNFRVVKRQYNFNRALNWPTYSIYHHLLNLLSPLTQRNENCFLVPQQLNMHSAFDNET